MYHLGNLLDLHEDCQKYNILVPVWDIGWRSVLKQAIELEYVSRIEMLNQVLRIEIYLPVSQG